MSVFAFGAGILYGVQTYDAQGNAITNPTPVQFGTMQDINCDMSWESKKLYGAYQFPLAVGRGKGKFDVKAKIANIDGRILSGLVFGQASSFGIVSFQQNEANTIPSTPYTLYLVPPSSGTCTGDLGVINATTGLPFTNVSAITTAGQYTFSLGSGSTGTYVFNSTDAGTAVSISYTYSATSTTKINGAISNQLMGYAPFFTAYLTNQFQGNKLQIKLNRCLSSQFTFPFKNDDFTIPDFSFEAMADQAGNVGTWSQA
jgi:hypothetical protein